MRDLERRVFQAEKLSSLGQLAASVAHEINNPMTAISQPLRRIAPTAHVRRRLTPGAEADHDKLKKIAGQQRTEFFDSREDLVSLFSPAGQTRADVDLCSTVDLAVKVGADRCARSARRDRRERFMDKVLAGWRSSLQSGAGLRQPHHQCLPRDEDRRVPDSADRADGVRRGSSRLGSTTGDGHRASTFSLKSSSHFSPPRQMAKAFVPGRLIV